MGNYIRGGYHNHTRWARSQRLAGKFIGIELEIDHHQGYNRILQLLPDPPVGQPRPSTERDGSLDPHTGVEIVFPPYRYTTLKSKRSFFAKAVNALKEGGARRGHNCGMHININTTGWEHQKIRTFCALVDWMPNEWFERIGGRHRGNYCRADHHRQLEAYGPCQVRGCMHVKNDWSRVEARFPAATVEHTRIANIVTFLEIVELLAARASVQKWLDEVLKNDDLSAAQIETAVGDGMLKQFEKSKAGRVIKEIMVNGYQD